MAGVALYKIADEYRSALDLDLDTELDAEALTQLLGEITERFEDKAAAVTAYMRNVEAEAYAYAAEADRLAKHAKALNNRSDSLKDYLALEMRRCNLTECKAGLSQLKFVKNPWHVEIEPDAHIPDKYMVTPPTPQPYPDKKALAEALKAGETIEGVQLKQDERLRIA